MNEKIKIWKDRKLFSFLLAWMLFVIVLWWKFYQEEVEIINTTSLAFTYQYGFISRGFIGSLFYLLDCLLPISLMNYDGVMGFTQVMTYLYLALLLGFFLICLMRCTKESVERIKYLIFFFSMFAISMFLTKYNFGRYDMYCLMLALIMVILLIYEKAEWLVIPLSAFSIMIHQGNVFYLLNITLVLLFYKLCSSQKKARKKYIFLLISCFVIASILFLYFEFFSRNNGADYVEQVTSVAKSLRFDGDIHEDIIDHEILGMDLADREVEYKYKNFVEFPVFCLFSSPYLILAFQFFKNIIKKSETKLEKWNYFFIAIGAGTMIPALILKCDFGRWVFMMMAYYFVVILALLAMKDKRIEEELYVTAEKMKKLGPAAFVLLAYPAFFLPFKDVVISQLSYNVADIINAEFLHLWK